MIQPTTGEDNGIVAGVVCGGVPEIASEFASEFASAASLSINAASLIASRCLSSKSIKSNQSLHVMNTVDSRSNVGKKMTSGLGNLGSYAHNF